MTSEIRANTIKNRVGLGTVSFTNTGPVVSGIVTANGLELNSVDAGSTAGPELKLFRNSASPADADYLGQLKFAGESDTGVERNYAKITGKILDASNGTEDGIIEFAHIKAGSQTITGRWRSDSLQLLNGTNLSVAGDTTLTGDLDVDRHTNLDNVSIAGVTTSAGIVQAAQFKLLDNAKAIYGNSGDMEIYHNATNSLIQNGTGSLQIITTTGNLFLRGQDNITFNTAGNNERLRITSAGNVGINETTPESRLELDGRFRILDNSDGTPSTGKGLEISYYTSDDMADILSYDRGGGSYKKLQLRGSSIELKKNNTVLCNIGTGGNNASVGFSTTVNLVTNAEAVAVRGYSSFKSPSATYAAIYTNNELEATGVITPHILFNNNGANRGGFGYHTDNHSLIMANHTNIIFKTGATQLGGTEKLRIQSDGKVTLGTTTPSSNSAAYMFTIADPTNSLGNCGMTIRAATGVSGGTHQGSIFYSNATSGTGEYAGYLQYNHNDNWFRIGVNSDEKFRISSNGQIEIRTNNTGNPAGITIRNINTNNYSHARLRLESQNAARYADIFADVPNDALRIAYNSSNSIYFKSDGRLGINANPSVAHEYLHLKPVGNNVLDIRYELNSSTDIRHNFHDDSGTKRGVFAYTRYANSTDYPNFHHSFYMQTDPASNGTLSTVMRLKQTGEFILPKQPCFSVTMSNDYSTSTSHTANFDTERFDQGDNFNTGSNGIFTAPVTGKYYMHAAIQTQAGGTANQPHIMGVAFTVNGSIQTSKGSGDQYLGRDTAHYITVHCIRILNLAAGDTVQVYILLHGTVSIEGSGGIDRCNWQGYLMA